MRFLVDECTGPRVATWLREKGHKTFSVYEEARGMSDEEIITKAFEEKYIILTNDKDFGELVIKQQKQHWEVIILWLKNERVENKIKIMEKLLEKYAKKIPNNLLIVTEKAVRIVEEK